MPHYLEAEALARQRRLLAEEEELEQRERERAEQKQRAKQRKKEKQKAKRSAAAAVTIVATEEEIKAKVDIHEESFDEDIHEENIDEENLDVDDALSTVDQEEQEEQETDELIDNQSELSIQQGLEDETSSQISTSPITEATLDIDEDEEPPGLSPALTSVQAFLPQKVDTQATHLD